MSFSLSSSFFCKATHVHKLNLRRSFRGCHHRFSSQVPGRDRSKILGELPSFVKIVEVGARDGLQNETSLISTDEKLHFIDLLRESGLQVIEAGAFVRAPWIPQMADSGEIMSRLDLSKCNYPVLVPNVKGFERALKVGVKEIAIFGSASETFSKKNTNASIEDCFKRFEDVTNLAKQNNVKVRGYVSCVMGCPYEGLVPLAKVVEVASRLYDLGCYEISLGDTIGVGTPGYTTEIIQNLKPIIPVEKLAVHFHDTYGQALANILAALQLGVAVVDSSVAGLGGCPYAKGASGNVATEEVLYMLKGLGIETGVSLEGVLKASSYISEILRRQTNSKVGLATLRKGKLPPNFTS